MVVEALEVAVEPEEKETGSVAMKTAATPTSRGASPATAATRSGLKEPGVTVVAVEEVTEVIDAVEEAGTSVEVTEAGEEEDLEVEEEAGEALAVEIEVVEVPCEATGIVAEIAREAGHTKPSAPPLLLSLLKYLMMTCWGILLRISYVTIYLKTSLMTTTPCMRNQYLYSHLDLS